MLGAPGHRPRRCDHSFLYGNEEFRASGRGSCTYVGWAVATIPSPGDIQVEAVMTATDDAGSPVFRLRRVRNAGPGGHRKKAVEILVEPGRQATPEMLLVMATGYYNLCTFFDRSVGG
jgi:hypothetical protein